MNGTSQRLTFLLPKDSTREFENVLKDAGIETKRAAVKAKSLDPATLDMMIKVIVALGGGAGIAVIVQRIADAVVKSMRDGRIVVKVRHPTLGDYSFENMNAKQIGELLIKMSEAAGGAENVERKK